MLTTYDAWSNSGGRSFRSRTYTTTVVSISFRESDATTVRSYCKRKSNEKCKQTKSR